MVIFAIQSTDAENHRYQFPPGQTKASKTPQGPSKREDLLLRWAAGGTFGLFADSITNLPHVIQTRKFASDAANIKSSRWLSTARKVITAEGLRGCYSGFPVVAVGSFTGTGAYCVVSHLTKEYLGGSDLSNLLAGYGGQLAGSTCGWTPSSVLAKIQQAPNQLKDPKFVDKKAREIAFELLKRGGIKMIYRGFWIQLANHGAINAGGELFAGRLRKLARDRTSTGELSVIQQAGINGLSWGVAAAITNPLGVCKLRVQLSGVNRQHFPDHSAIKCALRILKEEGVKAMYKGVSARVIAVTPRSMLFFTGMPHVYELLRKACHSSNSFP